MKNRGSLVVISGFAGVGKGSILNEMMKRHEGYAYSVSATTRSPRPGETDGVNYFFISREKFKEMIEKGELLEYASYVENYYGTPRFYVERMMAEGRDVLLEIDIQGAMNIRKSMPEAILVFVLPPSAGVLEQRLTGRGTETPELVKKRLARAAEEAAGVGGYDYIIVNDTIEESAEKLHQLIQAQRLRTGRNASFIEKIRKELESFKQPE
jgi:guanylate kinase